MNISILLVILALLLHDVISSSNRAFRPLHVRGLHLRQDLQGGGQADVSHDQGAHVRVPELPVPAGRGERLPVLHLRQGPDGSVPGAVEGQPGEPERVGCGPGPVDPCAGGPQGPLSSAGQCHCYPKQWVGTHLWALPGPILMGHE